MKRLSDSVLNQSYHEIRRIRRIPLLVVVIAVNFINVSSGTSVPLMDISDHAVAAKIWVEPPSYPFLSQSESERDADVADAWQRQIAANRRRAQGAEMSVDDAELMQHRVPELEPASTITCLALHCVTS